MVTYELWSTESNNLVEWYDTLEDLRAALRTMTDLEGLALAVRDARGKTTWVAPSAFYELSGS